MWALSLYLLLLVPLLLPFSALQTLISKLTSFVANPPLSISKDDTHHTMIVTILILERAHLFHTSLSRPTLKDALDRAYSQYNASSTHRAVMEHFPESPQEYSIPKYIEFILDHRLR